MTDPVEEKVRKTVKTCDFSRKKRLMIWLISETLPHAHDYYDT